MYTDNDYLTFALTMLLEAYGCAPKSLKWLEDNDTLRAIAERTKDNPHLYRAELPTRKHA